MQSERGNKKKTDYGREMEKKDKRDESKCALPETSIHSTIRRLLKVDFKKVQWVHQRLKLSRLAEQHAG